ncbi:hypothetical protein A0H81_03388 [Grifola frondosa]|uniref:Secreted protein n=1 Tax=Grifola frondosa TaxID=5627 RepID=A0A1C7MPH8_GRIFR|nr:hypothetical protein A0H81_03388 [Grifola frondosa]
MSTFEHLINLVLFKYMLFAAPAASDCTGTISSLDDVDAAERFQPWTARHVRIHHRRLYVSPKFQAFRRPHYQQGQQHRVPAEYMIRWSWSFYWLNFIGRHRFWHRHRE